tara:strand:- start:1296 stop:1811 length:516 start_codon:yes stop_codon:yes gene_type:complete
MRAKKTGLNGIAIFAIATPAMLWLAGRGVVVMQSEELVGREVVARDDGTLVVGPVSCASVSDLMHALRLGAALYRWKRLPEGPRKIIEAEANRVRSEDARSRFFEFTDAEIIVSRSIAGLPAGTPAAQKALDRFAMAEVVRWGIPIGPAFFLTILPVQILVSMVRIASRTT